MALGERSTAYDISIFEERKYIAEKKDNILEIPNKKAKANKKSKLKVIPALFTVIIFSFSVAAVGTMLANQVQLTEVTEQTNRAKKLLEERKSENMQLQMKLKEKFSPEKVTNFAKYSLSMEQTNSSQVEYISLTSGDKAEITQQR